MTMSASNHQANPVMINRRRIAKFVGMFFEFRRGYEKTRPSLKSPTNTIMKLNLCMLLLCTISLYLVALNTHSVSASYYKHNHNYDPEQQDGIPVFSARSIAKMDDDWTNGMQESIRPRAAQRRQTDNDLDDGLEEDDEDEYRSGSSPHESVASPSYGESQRFARDGDEIEDFFDKHLGPPKETDSVDESADQPTIVQQEATVPAVDPDDQYEAAASGPLSSIFQSLLGHSQDGKHSKRPFLQITTSSSSDSDATTTKDEPKAASTGSGLKASQSAQSFVEASPVALAIAPVADSSIQKLAGSQQDPSSGIDSGVREIYIGRRPTVMSYLQQQQQQQKPLPHLSGYTTAGSANIWRGPNGQPVVYEQEQANDYSRYPVAASYAYQQQPSNSAQASEPATGGVGSDDDEQTVTYGLSFGGGGESSAAADEPAQDQEAVDPAGSGQVETHPIDHQQQQRGYVPYNTRYTTSSSRALNNYYSNYYRQPPAGYVRAYPIQQQQQMFRQQQMMPMQYQSLPYHQHSQQHYNSNAPTRYHRDPSESSAQSAAMRVPAAHRGANYDQSNYDGMIQQQHRGLGGGGGSQAGAKINQDQLKERQRLLASLDREIKASPQYRSNHATTGDASAQRSSYLRRPSPFDDQRRLVTYKEVKNNYLGDDLDTYNSYHSETDPYKTRTTTSRMVNDPFLARGRQQSRDHEELDSKPNQDPASTSNYVANQTPELNYSSAQGYQQVDGQRTGPLDNNASNGMQPNQQQSSGNLLTGPLMTNYDTSSNQASGQEDLLRNNNQKALNGINGGSDNKEDTNRVSGHSRVRRDDSDEREIDNDTDDDGVWVDDDDDDDNRQQSSDVNETSQQPEEEEDEEDGQQDDASNHVLTPTQLNPPGVIGGPHGYELSPNDLMIYHG